MEERQVSGSVGETAVPVKAFLTGAPFPGQRGVGLWRRATRSGPATFCHSARWLR